MSKLKLSKCCEQSASNYCYFALPLMQVLFINGDKFPPQLLVQIASLKGTGEFFGWEKNPGQLANCHKFSKMMLRYAGIFRQTKLCNNELVFQRKFLSGWFSVDRPLVYFLCFHNIFSLLFWIGHHYETRFLSRRGQQQRPSHKLVTWSKANFCISLSF